MRKMRKKHMVFLLFLVFPALLVCLFLQSATLAANLEFKTFTVGPSGDYPLEDAILKNVEPNVLFYLDVGANMTMSMKGQRPSTNYDLYPEMEDAYLRIEMLSQDSFGMGGRPVSDASGVEQTGVYRRWGRDLDDTNNIIGHPDCYYSMDPEKPYFLTFKDYNWANWNGQGDPPPATGNTRVDDSNPYVSPNSKMPDDLKDYLPGGAKAGESVTDPTLVKYLVPNDSKMYKQKLVMSRLLAPSPDGSGRNEEILARSRVAVATPYYGDKDVSTWSMSMKNAPYRFVGYSDSQFYDKTTDQYYLYHNGAYTWVTVPSYSGIAFYGSGFLDDLRFAYGGVPYSYTYGGLYSIYDDQGLYKRSVLHIPFDFMYTKEGASYVPTPSLLAFREMIDGVEQVNLDYPYNVINDEFFCMGQEGTPESQIYATANYPTRPAPGYPTGADGSVTLQPTGRGLGEGVRMRRMRNGEGLMTGTIVGTARDFFHPKDLTYDEGKADGTDDTRGYFPVTGSCQGNWIIYFTTGNETDPGWSVDDENSMMHSLQQIFLESKEMRGRNWNGQKWVEHTFEMDHPIRTVVVGLITTEGMEDDGDPYDKTSDSQVKRLRKAMRRMAHAGQPKDDGTPDTTVEPIFADDVPTLVEKLQSVLAAIRTERLAGGAPRLLLEDKSEKDGDLALFASSYTLDSLRQWGSAFSRYTLPKGEVNSVLKWDAGKKMEADTERKNKLYTAEAEMDIESGTNTVLIDALSNSAFASLAGIPQANAQEFKDWLIRYANASGVQNENGILGNMEHSVYLTVGSPDLDGIDQNRPERIYIQTNRGVLHSLDYEDGVEKWAFIPPNIFQHRLKYQKFEDNVWMSGDGENTRSSQPLMLLDGLLAAHDIELGSKSATYMTGALGGAGNGFYMMDVTNPNNVKPQFVWAIDNDRYETPKNGSVHRWGSAFADYEQYYKGYEDLGLTIVAPELKGVKKSTDGKYDEEFRYVGIIPGGLGYNLNDSQGRALYIFEPSDGSIIKKITTDNGYAGPVGSTLGMGITPVHFLYEDEKTKLHAKEFFTGDSEGNVLHCDMTRAVEDWKLKSIFRLRAAGDKPIALSVGYVVLQNKQNQWLFGGTSDITAPGQIMLTMPSGEKVNQQREIHNDEQYIFGLHTKNPKAKEGVKTDLSYPTGNTSVPVLLTDLTSLEYQKTDPEIIPAWEGEVSKDQPEIGANGWKLGLRPKVLDDHTPTEAEYVTSELFFKDGVLYAATFIPFTELPTDQERCRDIGYGKLYALDLETGESAWKGGQAYVFKNIKIVGISTARGNLFLGVKTLKAGALEAFGQYEETKDYVTHAENSIVEIKSARGRGPSLPDIPPEIPHLQYWRETF